MKHIKKILFLTAISLFTIDNCDAMKKKVLDQFSRFLFSNFSQSYNLSQLALEKPKLSHYQEKKKEELVRTTIQDWENEKECFGFPIEVFLGEEYSVEDFKYLDPEELEFCACEFARSSEGEEYSDEDIESFFKCLVLNALQEKAPVDETDYEEETTEEPKKDKLNQSKYLNYGVSGC